MMNDRETVPLIKAEKTPEKDVKLDPAGFFIITVIRKDKKIMVEYYANVYRNGRIVSGKLKKVFEGVKADAICDTIVRYVPNLRPEHYAYLGRELQKAQTALEKNEKYVQDGC